MSLHPLFRIALFCVLVSPFASRRTMLAQTLKPTPEQMRDALAQTSQLADIESAGAVPFRLTATFATFDYLGKAAGEGTLDETWLRPGVVHRLITFRGMSSDETLKNGSVREIHKGFAGSFMERRVIAALLNAVPEGKDIPAAMTLSYKPYSVVGGTLDCIIVKAADVEKATTQQDGPATAYCSDPVSHLLRLRQERYDFSVIYNNLARLGTHTIARQIQIRQQGKLRASLTVTSFAPAQNLLEKDFVLPENAEDMSRADIALPEETVAGSNVKKITPVYPASAKQNHISGTVFLSASISRDGSVGDLDVISSPSPDLTESAISSVRQWKYKPYLLGGVPQEVHTTIRVNYSFSK